MKIEWDPKKATAEYKHGEDNWGQSHISPWRNMTLTPIIQGMTSEKTKAELRNLELGQPAAQEGGIFGAMIDPNDAALVLIPAPFDLTTSYGKGTMDGPLAISAASVQLDLFDVRWGSVFKAGIA
ncbi:MAG: arginase family protein, partial [Syntrophobacterales bacterium]|nr:arginase family protein [Syntrophobacterales bacterium]